MDSKISIIMPMFNRSATVGRALDSLLAQNYQFFEVIVVDDGSSDSSVERVRPYLKDSRFRLVELIENRGVNYARNYGLDLISSDSDWVTFLDSDDEFVEGALESIATVITSYPAVNDYCFSVRYSDGRAASFLSADSLLLGYRDLFAAISRPSGEWVHVIRAQLVREKIFRYEESVRNGFEAISYLRLARENSVLYSSKVVRLYHLDVEGLTRISNKTKAKSYDEISGYTMYLKEFGKDLLHFNKSEYALVLSVLGKTYLEIGDLKNCLNKTLTAFRCNPFELRIYRNVLLALKYFIRAPFNPKISSLK
ncbi:MAG: glycosyltransferase family 2 protein [Gammaproteobacteria bacterium]|jgi:glycosyltransferase involved in cell wall biosynthesis|nr:glycosyltransferase family 2 protein [Gammaproteobacteria bacterium]